jgi:beta-xylosidase
MPNSKGEVWIADLGVGSYRNPIIHADYSDPDAIRVGNDFYMVASSFNAVPGVPLLHSKDLVNWSLINHVLERLPSPEYDVPRPGRGAWAPSIRLHDGLFYVFIPMPDEGIFVSTADDPAGRWSPPACLRPGKGWIDPCPFWDDDGQAYLVNAFAASRIGIKSIIHVSRMMPDGSALLDEGVHVFDGRERHPTIEGPKLYKRKGWYYIFAPAGGVQRGWQTVLRSRSVWGPYEDRIVLAQGGTEVNGPHQGAWVELANGESWFLHFQDKGAYGRIVHLQPMRWEDDWPVIGAESGGKAAGEPVAAYRKPGTGTVRAIRVPATSDAFTGPTLGLQWQWEANPKPEWYSLSAKPGRLRLRAQRFPLGRPGALRELPSLLCQKFPAPAFRVETALSMASPAGGDMAGLSVLGESYAYCALENRASGAVIVFRSGADAGHGRDPHGGASGRAIDISKAPGSKCILALTVEDGAICRFSYSFSGEGFTEAGPAFRAEAGDWVGAKVGIFAVAPTDTAEAGFADFDYFAVSEPRS